VEMAEHKSPGIAEYQAFVAFSDHGDVRAAAQALHCSQPSISRALGVFQAGEMLEKRGRALALTARGKRLLPTIRAMLESHDQLGQAIQQTAAPTRRLSIGTGRFEAELFLPALAAEIQKTLPDVKFRIRLLRGEQRILKTASGELDLTIVTHDEDQIRSLVGREFGDSVKLAVELLAMHPLHVAARRDTREGAILSSLPQERPIRLSQIAGWPLHALDPDSGIRRQLVRDYRDAGDEEPPFLLEGGDFHIAKAFAHAGLGVAFLPEPLLSQARSDLLVSRPLATRFNLHTRLVYREGNFDAHVMALRKLLRKRFQGV
jgi:DNA-binding transcriptional LysR family regulator